MNNTAVSIPRSGKYYAICLSKIDGSHYVSEFYFPGYSPIHDALSYYKSCVSAQAEVRAIYPIELHYKPVTYTDIFQLLNDLRYESKSLASLINNLGR